MGKTSLGTVTEALQNVTYRRGSERSHGNPVNSGGAQSQPSHFTDGIAGSQKGSVSSPRSQEGDKFLAVEYLLFAGGTVN